MSKLAVVLFALVALAAAGPAQDEPVPILSQEQDISPDGSFQAKFETGNGIAYQEQGTAKQVGDEVVSISQGTVSYTAPDGTPIQLSWVADENGFQPKGAHLPVAPVIPEAIQRALDYIAAHPYVEPKN